MTRTVFVRSFPSHSRVSSYFYSAPLNPPFKATETPDLGTPACLHSKSSISSILHPVQILLNVLPASTLVLSRPPRRGEASISICQSSSRVIEPRECSSLICSRTLLLICIPLVSTTL